LATRPTVNEYVIDLLEVRLDDAEEPIVACAHVVARSPWPSGHWLRGRILVVMNAEFIGDWDIAPRGHPNDGRVEVVDVDPSMSARERLAARRRLPTGTHVPHPRIATRSVRTGSWQFARPLDVVVDGRRVDRASTLSIDVLADAATVYA
jgi:diacylglycerol kinase family enzyme